MSAFGPLAARFLDASRGFASAGELARYASALPADGLILDAMCGTGRVLVPWVRKMLRAFMISSMGLSEVSSRMAAGRTKDGEDVIDGEFTRVDQDRLPR